MAALCTAQSRALAAALARASTHRMSLVSAGTSRANSTLSGSSPKAKAITNSSSNAGTQVAPFTCSARACTHVHGLKHATHNQHSEAFKSTQPKDVPPPSGSRIAEGSFVGMSGGQIFHEMMLHHGVGTVFGYPGGAILPVYDAIYQSENFGFVLPRHEQGAGHMAEGYARVTGKPGVCLVTSGPGATNVITPIQDAYSDGIPMVVFCGQVPTSAIGTDAFQEADVIGISRSCTKWNVMVKDVSELPRRINEAFEIATTGRPGPVLVDLPKDITAGILNRPIKGGIDAAIPRTRSSSSSSSSSSGTNYRIYGNSPSLSAEKTIGKLAKLLNNAQKPLLYVGNGVLNTANGPEILKKFVEKANVPVTTTLQGLGAFDELDPRSLRMLGMHGSAYANLAMQTSDLIIALGARFDDRVIGAPPKFAPAARRAALSGRGGIFQFEILPKNINKVIQVTDSIEGDLGPNLEYLSNLALNRPRTNWFAQLDEWKRKYPFSYVPSKPGESMKPQHVIQELDRQTKDIKDKVIITTGVGQHQMWAAQYFRWRYPRSLVSSGGLGTMGFGLPSAIGAKVGAPDKIVIDIDGDASFSMTAMELQTARQYDIPVKVLLLNNDFQGMVKQWQDLFYDKRYSGTPMRNPDFVKLAESMGCEGIRCTKAEDLPAKMKQFLETDQPVVFECTVEKHEHVYPMVPAGKALHEMELGNIHINEPGHKFVNSFMAP